MEMCKHLDPSSGKCALMNIGAHVSLMDPATKAPPDVAADPESKGRAVKVCAYQIPGWKRGALSCQVPEIEEKEYKIPYFKMFEILQASTQILNRLSQEPEDRSCGHCRGTGTVTPPQCRIVQAVCPTPSKQSECILAARAEGVEEDPGPKMQARLEDAYDKVYDAMMFEGKPMLKDDGNVDDEPPRRGRVSTPLQRMREEGRA